MKKQNNNNKKDNMKSFNCFITEKVDKKYHKNIKKLIDDIKILNKDETGIDQDNIDRTVKMLEKMLKESQENSMSVITLMIDEGKTTEEIVMIINESAKNKE